MAFVALKRKLVPQGTWGSGNPGEKAKGDQIAKKIALTKCKRQGWHVVNNGSLGLSSRASFRGMAEWRPQEDASIKAQTVMSPSASALPSSTPWGRVGT